MLTRMYRVISVMGLALILVQCGPSGKEGQVEFSLLPEEPVVITGSIDVESKQIEGPWFSFGVKVSNRSDSYVTIVGIELEVMGRSTGNAPLINTTSIAASEFNKTVAYGDSSCSYQFFTFDAIPPGAENQDLTVSDAFPEGEGCPNILESKVKFYVGGNPSKEDDNVRNYSYKVKFKPLGWFGTEDAPEDRFEKTVRFTTQ